MIVGITGGIGSGKTYIAKIFQRLNYKIYNADSEAKYLMNNSAGLISQLKLEFGDEIYEKNQINSSRLSNIVFSNPEKLKTLNSIVHPAVKSDFLEWAKIHLKDSKIVFIESAILFESGFDKLVDKIIAIESPQDLKIKRVIIRDKTDENSVIKRIKNQLSDKKIIKNSDFIIINSEKKLLLPQVLKIINNIKND